MKAIEEHGKHLAEIDMLDKKDDIDTYDSLIFLKQKEIINELYNKILKNRRLT